MPTTARQESDADLFSDDVLNNPYPTFAELRAAAPAVFMTTLRAWAIPRYAEAREALSNHEALCSGQGIALNEAANAIRRTPSSSVIASDPPRHGVLRSVLSESLAPKALRKLKADIERQADELVDEVLEKETFDAVKDLAERFPVQVVADLIGLPEEGRDQILIWADGAFNAAGPPGERTEQGIAHLQQQLAYLTTVATRHRLRPGSMGAAVYEAADRGDINADTILPLMSAYLSAGMDTTINAIGNAIWLFSQHPDEWAKLRHDPSLIPSAFNEVLRIESPLQWMSRVTTVDYDAGGVIIPEGSRVALLFASANRDERKWNDPEKFDISRNAADHLALGYGIHGCAGQGLARLEAHAIFAALARRVERFDAGEGHRRINNTARGFSSLMVSHRAA